MTYFNNERLLQSFMRSIEYYENMIKYMKERNNTDDIDKILDKIDELNYFVNIIKEQN